MPEITVLCDCGAKLEITRTRLSNEYAKLPDIFLEVEPCPYCIKEAWERSKEEP